MDKFKKTLKAYPITSGMRQDISQDVMPPDTLSLVENFVYRKEGEAVSRDGFQKIIETSPYPNPRLFSYGNQLLSSSNKRLNIFDFREETSLLKNRFINLKNDFFFISQKERDIFYPSILRVNDIIHYGYVFQDRVYVKEFDTVQEIISSEETALDQQDFISGLKLMSYGGEVHIVYSAGSNIYVNKVGNNKGDRVTLNVPNLEDFDVLNGSQIHYKDGTNIQKFRLFLGTSFGTEQRSGGDTISSDDNFIVGGDRAFGFRKWVGFRLNGLNYEVGWARYTGMIVVNEEGDIVSKINSAQTPIMDRPDIKTKTPYVTIDATNSTYIPLFFSGQAEFDGSEISRPIGIGLLKITEADSDVQSSTLNNHMMFAGSSLNLYDGENFVEYGFTKRPEASLTSITVPERTAPREVPEVQEGDYQENITMDKFNSLYNEQSFTFSVGVNSTGVGYVKGSIGSISSGSADLHIDGFEVESIIYNTTIKAIEVTLNKIGVVGAFQIDSADYKIDDRTVQSNKSVGRHYTAQPAFVSGQTYTFQMQPTNIYQTTTPLGTIDVAKNIIGNGVIFEEVSDYKVEDVGTTTQEQVNIASLTTNSNSDSETNRWSEDVENRVMEWRDSGVGEVGYLSKNTDGINFGASGDNQINFHFGYSNGDEVLGENANSKDNAAIDIGDNDFIWGAHDYSYDRGPGKFAGGYSVAWRARDFDGNLVPSEDIVISLKSEIGAGSNPSSNDVNDVDTSFVCVYGDFLYVGVEVDFDRDYQDGNDLFFIKKIDLNAKRVVLSRQLSDYSSGSFLTEIDASSGLSFMTADSNYLYLGYGRRIADSPLRGGIQVYSTSTFIPNSSLSFGDNEDFYKEDEVEIDSATNAHVYNQKLYFKRDLDDRTSQDLIEFDLTTRSISDTLYSGNNDEVPEVAGGLEEKLYLDRIEKVRYLGDSPPVLTIAKPDGGLDILAGESSRVNINGNVLQIAFTPNAGDLNSEGTLANVELGSIFKQQLIDLEPDDTWICSVEYYFDGVGSTSSKTISFESFSDSDNLYVEDSGFDFNTIIGRSITFKNDGGSHSFVLTNADLVGTAGTTVNKTLASGTLDSALISTQTGTAVVSYEKDVTTYETVISTIPRLSYFTLDVGKLNLAQSDLQSYITLTRRSDATVTQAIPLSVFKSISNGRHLWSSPIDGLITYPFTLDSEFLSFVYPGGTTSTTTIAIAFQNRTYGYRYLYKWIDAKGFEHRSSVSEPVIVKTENDISESNVATLSLSTINITRKRGVVIELYRTKKDSNLYRRVADIDNVKNTERLTYIDGKSDDDLGSPLEPFLDQYQPDGGNLIERFADRFCVSGFSVEKNKLIYSKPVNLSGNFGISFSENDFLILDAPIVAIKRMDAFLIIFTEDTIYAWVIGQEPEYISGSKNNSVIDANSVVETSAGIVFKSQKGIYLLTRGRELKYIGIAVQNYNHIKVLRSLEMKRQNEIRFILESNDILVYNYHYNKWSVLKGDFKDGIVHRDDLYLIDTSGVLWKEDGSDPSSDILSTFETGWISLNQHTEYDKLKSFRLTAEFDGLELLGATIYYDFSLAIGEGKGEILDVDNEKHKMNNIDAIEIPNSEFGVDSLSDLRLIRFLPRRQKCNSFKVKLTFRAKKAKVTALAFEHLVSKSLGRVPQIAQV